MRRLVIVYSPDKKAINRTIEVEPDLSITFGREASGAGAISDPLMSRTHARVAFDGDLLTIEDLGASNGTLVDGLLMEQMSALESGAVISLGDTLIVVDEEPLRSALP